MRPDFFKNPFFLAEVIEAAADVRVPVLSPLIGFSAHDFTAPI
jgi:hypothetical protein